MNTIQNKLFGMQDNKYRDFHAKLMPSIDKNRIIGVRTPHLRKYAKEIFKTKAADSFLNSLPHTYYEENNLHAFLIEQVNDFEKALKLTDSFLPYVDNWATCDGMSPKAFKRQPEMLMPTIIKWINSNHEYTVRFGILCLMRYFLDERFKSEYLETISSVKRDEYYIKMMAAWYFATALSKQYDLAIKYFESGKLDTWTHNKAIQKAIESRVIPPTKKEYLKTLKKRNEP